MHKDDKQITVEQAVKETGFSPASSLTQGLPPTPRERRAERRRAALAESEKAWADRREREKAKAESKVKPKARGKAKVEPEVVSDDPSIDNS